MSGLIAFLVVVSYYIKPTLVITYIAGTIIKCILMIRGEKRDRISIKSILTFALIAITLFLGTGFMVNNQRYVVIDRSKSEPLTHFIAMGLKGKGGYHLEDVEMDAKIKGPVKRNQANIYLIKKRLVQFGSIFNYEKFLINKQIFNTSDGTFGWGHEGIFLVSREKNNAAFNRSIQRKLFAKDGIASGNNFEYKLAAQVIWILVLGCCFFAFEDNSLFSQFLKYSITGYFIFILIFEGGRSRYVVQFLPVVLLLSAVGLDRLGVLIGYKKIS